MIAYLDANRTFTRHVVLDEKGKVAHAGAPWQNVGTANFNRSDSYPDILWHNASTNETQIWYMAGNGVISRQDVLEENGSPAHVGAPWQIAGVANF